MTEPEPWGRRARSMAEMGVIHGRTMEPPVLMASIRAYRPRATDIVISPAGKCGTTWLQQTFHTLRTGGDMDFDDISRVVPWIETALSLGLDINAEQRANPRGFKSHLSWHNVPKGAKYIVSVRDPKDAFVSAYRFMEGWYFEPGTISYEEYFDAQRERRGKGLDIWSHLVSWWQQRENPDVLLLSYEHMVADRELAIRRIADFCGIALDDKLLALTLEHTSMAFMLRYKDRFDDAMLREVSETRGGLPRGSDSAKVRKGGSGGHRQELPASVSQELDAIWATDVLPATGHADYASLEAAVRLLAA
ncbi:MAG: sulfotransferase domain-containing protein [Pseudomonadales bacterium]